MRPPTRVRRQLVSEEVLKQQDALFKKAIKSGYYIETEKMRRRYQAWKKKNPSDKTGYSDWYRNIRKQRLPTQKKKIDKSNKDSDKLVPWIPCVIKGTTISEVEPIYLESKGHGNKTFGAKWFSLNRDLLGVVIKRKNMASNQAGVPAMYIGNAYESTRNLQLKSTNQIGNMGRLKNQNALNNSIRGIRGIKNAYSGPSVAEINSLINNNNSKTRDLLSYKLIGDRFTIDTAVWVNSDTRHVLFKPFDFEIGKEIVKAYYSGRKLNFDNFKNLANTIRDKIFKNDKLNIVFEKAGIFTNDRPAVLYSLYGGAPGVIQLPGNKYYMFKSGSLNDITTSGVNDPVLSNILTKTDPDPDPAIQIKKIAILDCFHDFAIGTRASIMEFGNLKRILSQIYGMSDFLDLFTTAATVKEAQNAIKTQILDNPRNSPRIQQTSNVDEISENFKDMALIYDAGVMPKELKNRRAALIQRVANSASAQPQKLGELPKK